MLNAIKIVVSDKITSPQRNKTSASFSNLTERISFLLLIDKKENRQLLMKHMMAKAAPSSIKLASLNLLIFDEVSTTKQKPNRLADVLRIWVDFEDGSLLLFICFNFLLFSKKRRLLFSYHHFLFFS